MTTKRAGAKVEVDLRLGAWPAGFYYGGDAATGAEVALDYGPDWIAGFYYVFEDLVGDVLLEDAEIAIAEEVFLIGLELDAALARHVAQGNRSEVGQAGLGADGGEFRIVDEDLVTGKLIGPCFNGRKCEVEPCFRVLVCVTLFECHRTILVEQGLGFPEGSGDWFFRYGPDIDASYILALESKR